MNDWNAFFECVDALEPSEREDYTALLHRNFVAVGHPKTWQGFLVNTPEIQARIIAEWDAWKRGHSINGN